MSIIKKDNVDAATIKSVSHSLRKFYEKMKNDQIHEILVSEGNTKHKQIELLNKSWDKTFKENPIFKASDLIEDISKIKSDEMVLEELFKVITETGNKSARKIAGSALDKKRKEALTKYSDAKSIIYKIESPRGKEVPVVEETTTIRDEKAFNITDTSLAAWNRDGYRKLLDTALTNEMRTPMKSFSDKQVEEKEESKIPSRMEAIEMFFASDVMKKRVEDLRLAEPKKAKKFIKKHQKEEKTIGKLKTMENTIDERRTLEQKIQQALEMLSTCNDLIPSNKLEKAKKDLEKQYAALVKQDVKETKTIDKIVENGNLQVSIENGKTYIEVTKELENLRPLEDIENEIYKIDNGLETLTDKTRIQDLNTRRDYLTQLDKTNQERMGEINAILNGMVTSHIAHITKEPIHRLNEAITVKNNDITNTLSKDTKSNDEIAKYDRENSNTRTEKQVEIEKEEI